MRYIVVQKNLFNLILRTGWLTHESFYRNIFNEERLDEICFSSKYPVYEDINSAYLNSIKDAGDAFWEGYTILSVGDFDKEVGVSLSSIKSVYTSRDFLESFEYQVRNSKLPVFSDPSLLLNFKSLDFSDEHVPLKGVKCTYLRPLKKNVDELIKRDRHLGAIGLLLLFGVDKNISSKLASGVVGKSHFNLTSKRGGNFLKALDGENSHVQRFLVNNIPQFTRAKLNDDLILSDVEALVNIVNESKINSFELKVVSIHFIFLNKYRKIRNAFSRESEKVIIELLDLRVKGVINWNEFHGCVYLLGYSVANSNLLTYKIRQHEVKVTHSPLVLQNSLNNILPDKLLDTNFGLNWRLHFSENDLHMKNFDFTVKCASGWLTVGELSQGFLLGESSVLQLNGVITEYERVKNGGDVNLSKISRQVEKYGPLFFDCVEMWKTMSHD